MPGEQLLLDPTSEATGTQLDITDTTLGYYLISHDYPDPEPDIVQASSIDTEGANPVAGKHQPRTIPIVVRCVQPTGGTPTIGTIVSNLQRKIGKLFREGGTYRRVLPSGDTITFDVLKFGARISVPADKRWVVRGTVDVTITLTCKPYGRGAAAAATLSASTATNTKAPLVFTVTGIKGDVPALGALTIGNVTNDKDTLIWGIRSLYYSSLSSNALFMESEDGSLASGGAGTLNAGFANASGPGANKVIRQLNVGTAGIGVNAYRAGATLSHVGTYRIYARVQASSTNTGIVSVRAVWNPRALGNEITNDAVPIMDGTGTAIKGSWVLADLGLVTVPLTRFGTQRWYVDFYAVSTIATDDLDWDWVAFVPVNEGFGHMDATNSGIVSTGAVTIAHDTAQIRNGGSLWYTPDSYEGDYLLIPPAGAEGRTAEFIVMATGTAGAAPTDTIVDATSFDAITAALTVTPRYLSVPAP